LFNPPQGLAVEPQTSHIGHMPFRTSLLILVLFLLLAGAVFISYSMWTSIGGDGGMNGIGVTALVLGALGSLVVGGGLMALMFFSSRRGYDDAADPKARKLQDR
jgi:predicted phage tail protein